MHILARPSFTKPNDGHKPIKGLRLKRRMAMLRDASKVVEYLPASAGEATHVLMQGRYDLMVLIVAILGIGKTCQFLRIATLSFNDRNTTEMVELLRTDKVDRLTLLCSEFFQENNRDEFAKAKAQADLWPGRFTLAAARNHAKVILIDGAYKLVIEGSANLRTNGNCEQIAVIRDDALHDWHAEWIETMVRDHGQTEKTPEGKPRRRVRQTG